MQLLILVQLKVDLFVLATIVQLERRRLRSCTRSLDSLKGVHLLVVQVVNFVDDINGFLHLPLA